MKRFLTSAAFITAVLVILPALPTLSARHEKSRKKSVFPHLTEFETDDTKKASCEPYKVLDVSTGEVIEVPVREYVIGAVCAEMPASFHSEALKAQAAAAHTYAERQRLFHREHPDPELMGADFSSDVSKYQGYYTEEQARQVFGADF